jgi:GMP synthase (glutamine-hydrolysing)
MSQQILILDFGSQYTQLIARRVRELNVYCEIHPFNKVPAITSDIKGVILSGSPCSVRDQGSPNVDLSVFANVPGFGGVLWGATDRTNKRRERSSFQYTGVWPSEINNG